MVSGSHLTPAVAVVLIVGCNKVELDHVPTVPVQATFTVGGEALDAGLVILHATPPKPGVPAPIGTIADDGTLTLTTFDRGDGAPPGDYVVTVHSGRERDDDSPGGRAISVKYSSPRTSDVFLRVQPEALRLGVIQLD
jgi:hypothetical protein